MHLCEVMDVLITWGKSLHNVYSYVDQTITSYTLNAIYKFFCQLYLKLGRGLFFSSPSPHQKERQ